MSTSELDQLRDAVRDFLAARSAEKHVRAAVESDLGYDPGVYAQMAEQLGLQGLAIPAEHGGDGFGAQELAVVFEELGRALTPGPFFATIALGASALIASGDAAAQARYLPGIVAGTTTATVALAESDGVWSTDALQTRACIAEDGWTIRGEKWFVVDGAGADIVLVVAATDDGPSLFAAEGSATGLDRAEMRTLDFTRRLAHLTFAETPATLVGEAGDADRIIAEVVLHATAALAAEQVGGARACLEAATAYARDRVQFGRQIGSFQAIKHKCADIFVRVQLAAAAATEAAGALDGATDSETPELATAVAHAVCSEAFMFAAAENIQVHGGIGFTWEHPAHLYFRRAKSSQLLFGGPAMYYARVLTAAGV